MKTAIIHVVPDTGQPVGVWTNPEDAAYLLGQDDAFEAGSAIMATCANPDWADWCDALAGRYPMQVLWEEKEVGDNETASQILRRIAA